MFKKFNNSGLLIVFWKEDKIQYEARIFKELFANDLANEYDD
jgi:hypothetical protein